jgi:ribosomal protein L11 methyltransferase
METEPLFQIIVTVPRPALEAVANRINELGISGLQWEDDKNPCNLMVYVYGEKNSDRLIGKIDKFIDSIKEIFPDSCYEKTQKIQIDSQSWAHEWKKFFKPTKITELLIVKPTWENYIPEKGEIVIDIDPEMAFGTGTHESTHLCLKALENLMNMDQNLKGCSLLDIGTGTGILAIAAVKFGAKSAVGVDIDPIAIETAVKNASLNRVDQHCEFKTESIENLNGTFDMIIANINSETLCELAPRIAALHRPLGHLILSGIVNERADEVKTCFQKQGYENFHREIMNEWTSWQTTKIGESR